MKHLVSIVFFVMTLFGGSHAVLSSDVDAMDAATIMQPLSENFSMDELPNKDLLLTNTIQLIHAGENASTPQHYRTQHAGGHGQGAFKTFSRYLKDGRSPDEHLFYTPAIFLSGGNGLLTSGRRLVIICLWRI